MSQWKERSEEGIIFALGDSPCVCGGGFSLMATEGEAAAAVAAGRRCRAFMCVLGDLKVVHGRARDNMGSRDDNLDICNVEDC